MRYDLHHNLLPVIANQPKTIASSTTTNGIVIDLMDYYAIEFMAFVGAYTDGTYTVTLRESDDPAFGTSNVVDASDILGDLTAISLNTANEKGSFGYIGSKRYLRADVVSTSVTSGATVGITAFQGYPAAAPTV